MAPRRFKLLALDIDGTLLTSQGTISPATGAALHRARHQGLVVTLATGRRLATAQPFIDALTVTAPVILHGGAQIVDPAGGDLLYCNPLPAAEVATVVQVAIAEGVQPILYENRVHDQHLLMGPPAHDSAPLRLYTAERPDQVRRLPYEDLARVESALELAVIDALPTVQRVAARMKLMHCRALISYSARLQSYFLEVFHATCSKGEALRHLVARLGLTLDETVAVGDNYNDREMIQVAGLGVAMANAEPEIRAVADRVIASNDDDGIAALIDQLLGPSPEL